MSLIERLEALRMKHLLTLSREDDEVLVDAVLALRHATDKDSLTVGAAVPARPNIGMFASAADYIAAMDEWLAACGVMEVRSAEQLADGFPRWDEQGRRITEGQQEKP